MKKLILLVCTALLGLLLYSQQQILIEESLVVNIEVPVRVFKGSDFIDNLSMKDFEVYENGVRQKIEAVYFIKKDLIQRKDEKKKFSPQTERTFFLFFELTEYDPRIGKAVEYFVQNVLLPSDNLIAVTPIKTYRLKDNGLEIKPREEIVKELRGLIRKDAVMGSSEYRNAFKDIEDAARAIAGDIAPDKPSEGRAGGMEIDRMEHLLETYRIALQKLETMREVDQLKLLDFAEYLKSREGQDYVFLFYQREFIPVLKNSVLQYLQSLYNTKPAVTFMLSEIFEFNRRDVTVDIDKVKKRFADAATSIHFLFLSRPREHTVGIQFEEHSEDIFAPFFEIAKASGGFIESSANPEYLFKKAVESSENYYLLYYTPKEYALDGKFKEIKVKVKKKGYKVIHRLGYFAE